MKTIILSGLSIAVLLLVGYYGLFWLQYYSAMEESNKETLRSKCKDGIEEEFFGTVTRVERYEYNDFMNANFFALNIQTTDSTNRFKTYQFNLAEYRDVLAFAMEGQVIEKLKGRDTFVLKKNQGMEKSFTIPDCRLED